MMPPGWKRNGQELAGPCPECGGKDRCFTGAKTKLQFARCRQCNKSFHVGTTFLGEAKTKTKGTGDGPKGPPDRWFDYCRADGRISFQIMRWEAKEGSPKYIRPILPNGDWKLPKGKRVLYNRVDLKRRTDSGVLYVEGEKTAEAAKRLVPERIVTTSAGGADKVDWKPLAKRDIIIWPDFDAPGLAKARKVRAILKDLDATVRVVDLQDSGLPPKWDLADPVPDGVDLQELLKTYIPDDLLAELAAEDIDKAKGGKEVYDDANATNVGKALESLGLGLKTDDRNMTIVYKMPDGSWNLSGASVLRNEIRERCLLNGKGDEYRPFKMSDSDWTVAREVLAQRHKYDPFIEMVEALPAPQDVDNYASATLLDNHFGVTYPEERTLAAWAVRYIIIGMVQRAFEPGCQLDEVPILVAPQDSGKSSFLEGFFAPEHRQLFREGLKLNAADKTKVEALQGSALVELGEMAGVTKAEIDNLKAFITRKNDGNIRLTYRTDPFPMFRRCVFFGTANENLELPDDPTGNRRFVPITLGRPVKAIEPVMNELRDGLLAEGLARYKAGERANLPRDMKDRAAVAASRYRARHEYLESGIVNLEETEGAQEGLSLREVADRLNLGDRSRNSKALPASLLANDWTERRARKDGKQGRFWFPPAKPQQTQLT